MYRNKKNLLFVVNDFTGGGAEKTLIEIAISLKKRGWNIFFITLLPGGEYLKVVKKNNFDYFCLNLKSPFFLINFVSLFNIFHKRKFNLILSFLYWSNIFSRFLSFIFRVPLVNGMRNTDLWRTKFHTLIDRYTFSGVKYYVSNSEAARLRLMSIEKINPKKIIVIKNGINSKRFENLNSILYHDKLLSKDLFIKKYASLNDMNIDSDTFFIGYAARFTEVKDPMTALESFALFKKNHENSIFICVGKGPLEEKFMQRCADLKIENAVVKTGFLDDLSLFYQSLDIFVLTSYWEGIPNTVLEAMYFGVPVAACDSGGTSELLVHGKTGYVISSHKPSDIAEIWKNILNDREFVLNASLQSKMRVRRFFSQNHMIDRYEDLFIEIIG